MTGAPGWYQRARRTMPLSMRRQTALEKKRQLRDATARDERMKAVAVLRSGGTVPAAMRASGVKKMTCRRLHKAVKYQDDESLSKLLNPANNRAGRRRVIAKDESEMIKERIRFAASRGFAFDVDTLKGVMGEIASDGRPGFRTTNGTPSDAAIRHWRATNRDTTYRKAENKTTAKLNAERFDHVQTFETALKKVGEINPGIFDNPERLWNMDETKVSAEFGQRQKVFGSSDTHHGGSRANNGGKCGKHITAVLAVSASGRKVPPVFIISGKNVMKNWFHGLSHQQIGGDPRLLWLTTNSWCPRDALILMSENGSMEKRLIPFVIDHINRYVRQFVPQSESYCLTLDGHKSRNGTDWLDRCKNVGCEVIQAPSDTSHFLQACDATVNKMFQKTIRLMRDELCKFSLIATNTVQLGLMLGVMAYSAISADHIRQSFDQCGLWPMDYRFLKKFPPKANTNVPDARLSHLEGTSIGTRLPSVLKRRADKTILADVTDAIHTGTSASKTLQKVAILLKEHKTVNAILVNAGDAVRIKNEPSRARATQEVLQKGTPAKYLTFGELLDARKAQVAAEEAAQLRKKELKIERERKRAERRTEQEHRRAQVAAKRAERKAQKEERKGCKSIANRKRQGQSGESTCKRAREEPAEPEAAAVEGLLDLASTTQTCSN